MNDYVGRKIRNPEAARILDEALGAIDDNQQQPSAGPEI